MHCLSLFINGMLGSYLRNACLPKVVQLLLHARGSAAGLGFFASNLFPFFAGGFQCILGNKKRVNDCLMTGIQRQYKCEKNIIVFTKRIDEES
jgi:hypothetical protein